jgi:ubiquinone/menaquinone biosynthesis C-methylase UbiE
MFNVETPRKAAREATLTTRERPRQSRWTNAPVSTIPSTLHLSDELHDCLGACRSVVDLGCGVGLTALELNVRGHLAYTGVDINEAAIGVAERLVGRKGLGLGSFEVADARGTRLEGSQFDLTMMQALLTVVESAADREAVMSEARRLLRPGGGLYVADFLQAWHLPLYRERYLQGVERFGEEGTFEVPGEDDGFMYVAHHFSEREIVHLMTGSGFEVTSFSHRRVRTRSGNHVPGFVAMGRRS